MSKILPVIKIPKCENYVTLLAPLMAVSSLQLKLGREGGEDKTPQWTKTAAAILNHV